MGIAIKQKGLRSTTMWSVAAHAQPVRLCDSRDQISLSYHILLWGGGVSKLDNEGLTVPRQEFN
jgi:hypothetical protein